LLAALLLFSLRFTRSQNVIRPAKDSEKLHDICWCGDDIIYGVIIGESRQHKQQQRWLAGLTELVLRAIESGHNMPPPTLALADKIAQYINSG